MHTPIAYALKFPMHEHITNKNLNLIGLNLHFEELSKKRFPCLEYAYMAAKKGGIYYADPRRLVKAGIYGGNNERSEARISERRRSQTAEKRILSQGTKG